MNFETDYDARIATESALAWMFDHGWTIDDLRDFFEGVCDRLEEDEA